MNSPWKEPVPNNVAVYWPLLFRIPCKQTPGIVPPTYQTPTVPEPGSLVLLSSGILGLAGVIRRTRI